MKKYFATCAVALAGVLACSSTKKVDVPDSVSSGFDVKKHGFSFENYGGISSYSAVTSDALVRMFGEKAACVDGLLPCTPKPGVRAWTASINDAMADGRCEGFAVLSQLFFLGAAKPEDFGGFTAFDLQIGGNEKLGNELAYWFATQMAGSVLKGKTKKYYAADVMPFLAEILQPGQGEAYRIGIVNKRGKAITGGHALTPIGYDRIGDGIYSLRVYDNNLPGEERSVRIDTNANRWEYVGSANPSETSALYFGDLKNKNPLYFAPTKARVGTFACKFCNKGGGLSVVAQTTGDVSVKDSAGNSAGVSSGESVSQGNASIDTAFNYIVSGYSLSSIEIPGDANGDTGRVTVISDAADAKLALAGDDRAVSLRVQTDREPREDTPIAPDSDAGISADSDAGAGAIPPHVELSLDDKGVEVKGDNGASPTVSLTKTIANGDGTSRTVEVSVGAPSGSSVKASIDDNGKVTANVQGGDGNMNVSVSQTNGEKTTSGTWSTPVTKDSATTVESTVPKDGDAPLQATSIDGSGKAQLLTDFCKNGVKDGSETDIDCGGSTCDACPVSSRCASGADCESTVCHAIDQRCVFSRCEDGAKNDAESDVDCGGGTCNPCALGKSCAATSDCDTQACSVANKCVATRCVDGIKNNGESDVDCGGGICGACASGLNCVAPSDCATGICSAGKCVAPSLCVDGIKNGNETDIDCGGPTCAPCAPTKACVMQRDCTTYCDASLCTATLPPPPPPNHFWFDASDSATVSRTGAAVNSWTDKTFNAHVASVGVGDTAPTFVAAGPPAGTSAIDFVGSNRLRVQAGVPVSSNTTAIVVYRMRSAGIGLWATIMEQGHDAYWAIRKADVGGAMGKLSFHIQNNNDAPAVPLNYDTWQILAVTQTGTLSSMQYYGSAEVTSDMGNVINFAPSVILEIGNSAIQGQVLNGEIAEIRGYTNPLIPSERHAVLKDLAIKHGL